MYAIKLELKLNNKERTLMARHSGYARFCYNYALSLYQEVKSLPGGSSKKVAAIERVFTNPVKKMPEYQWTKTLSSRVYKMTFRHFGEALSRFFKGLGEFPKFKRKKEGDSFTVDAADWNHSILLAAKKSIKIPTLGTFRLKESIPFPCVAQTFTLSRTADKWYVSFALKAEKIPPLFHPVAEPVGIDLGVSTFATISDGNCYESPRPLKKAKTKLSKSQWRNRQKQLGIAFLRLVRYGCELDSRIRGNDRFENIPHLFEKGYSEAMTFLEKIKALGERSHGRGIAVLRTGSALISDYFSANLILVASPSFCRS